MHKPLPPALAGCAVFALAFGCDKLKTALSKGDEGGAASASSASPAAAVSLLGGFEGAIDVDVKDSKTRPPSAFSVALLVKAAKVRVDVPDHLASESPFGKGYVILDSTAKKLSIVSDPQKQVIVVDLNTAGQRLKGFGAPPHIHPGGGSAPPEGPKTTLTKTGKYDTVAGTKCENWDITSDHREGQVCVAQEGVSWFQMPLTGIPTEHLWAAELLDGKHFPLRFVGFDTNGLSETARIEVTKIDKKSVPDTEFVYPPTYRVVDIAQMFAGLPGMPGGLRAPPMAPVMPSGMPAPRPSHH